MKIKTLFCFLVTIVFLNVAQSNNYNQTTTAFKVTSPSGKTNLLIPTMHVVHDGLADLDPIIFNHAKKLVIEHSLVGIPTQAIANERKFIDNKPWQAAFDKHETHLINKHLIRCNEILAANLEMNPDRLLQKSKVFEYLTPEFLNSKIFSPCSQRIGLYRDLYFVDQANKLQLPIEYLESIDEIQNFRNQIPATMIVNNIKHAIKTNIDDLYRKVVDKLNDGDMDGLYALTVGSVKDTADQKKHADIMLHQRNHLWLPRLINYLEQENVIIAVGAGHFGSEYGLLSLLKQKGYQIEKIKLPTLKE